MNCGNVCYTACSAQNERVRNFYLVWVVPNPLTWLTFHFNGTATTNKNWIVSLVLWSWQAIKIPNLNSSSYNALGQGSRPTPKNLASSSSKGFMAARIRCCNGADSCRLGGSCLLGAALNARATMDCCIKDAFSPKWCNASVTTISVCWAMSEFM